MSELATPIIDLVLNGSPIQTDSHHLSDALQRWYPDTTTFAVAINGVFIPRGSYNTTQLAVGDNVEIVSPMQGG